MNFHYPRCLNPFFPFHAIVAIMIKSAYFSRLLGYIVGKEKEMVINIEDISILLLVEMFGLGTCTS